MEVIIAFVVGVVVGAAFHAAIKAKFDAIKAQAKEKLK